MSATTAPLQARIVKPEEASPLKAFGLDLKVLLTTEATGGAVSVLMGCTNPAKVRPTTCISVGKRCSSSSRAPTS